MKSQLFITLLFVCVLAVYCGDPPPSPYYPKYQFAGDYLYISGANGADETGLIKGDVYNQTIQTLQVLVDRLHDAGTTIDKVVKVRGWLGIEADFDDFNRAYTAFFPINATTNPARSMALADALTGNNSRIELEFIAYVGSQPLVRGPLASPYYSSYVKGGDFVWISGTNAAQPSGAIVGDILNQTGNALFNIGQILNSAGCTYKDVVKVEAVLGQDAEIDDFNSIYAMFFDLNDTQHLPSRSLSLGVAHQYLGSRVELDAIAYKCGASDEEKQVRSVNLKNVGVDMDPPVKVVGDYAFVSGHLGKNASGIIPGNVTVQTNLALAQIQSDLAAAGFQMEGQAIFVHGWLTTDADFGFYNLGYVNFFPKFNTTNPARSMSLGVPINGQNARVEIEMVAYKGSQRSSQMKNKFLSNE